MQRPKINGNIEEEVQKYADKHYEGNFTQAVRTLLIAGLRRKREERDATSKRRD